MINWRLAFVLGASTFSLDRKSLRFPVGRRILAVCLLLPFFLVLTFSNRFFMLLDWVFFPFFSKEKIDKPVFIVGVARSATTFLYKTMAKDHEQFTCFRFWELLFAPSIIQKYICVGIIALDRKIGRPVKRLALQMDKIFLKRINRVHETGLNKVEEDEILLLYTFSSMYLNFFYPEVKALDQVLFFDEQFPEKRKKRVMNYYRRCVQRHMYVFGNSSQKTFLSKNPAFISKLGSIADLFPDAKLIYMIRSPYKTIPSVINMNALVSSLFCNTKYLSSGNVRTSEVVMRWYEIADASIRAHWTNRHLIVPFKEVTSNPKETLNAIYSFLAISSTPLAFAIRNEEQGLVKQNSTTASYDQKAGVDSDRISSRLKFILEGPYKDLI